MTTGELVGERTKLLERLLDDAQRDAATLGKELSDRRKRRERRRIRNASREMHTARRRYMLASNSFVQQFVGKLRDMSVEDLRKIVVWGTHPLGKSPLLNNKCCKYYRDGDVREFVRDVLRERFFVVADIHAATGKSTTTIRRALHQACIYPSLRISRRKGLSHRWLNVQRDASDHSWLEFYYPRQKVCDLFGI